MVNVGWVDWVFITILVLSVIVGLMRGLVYEVMSLLGWLVAYFGAQWFAQDLGRHVPFGTPGSAANRAAAFVAVFIGVLVLWGLVARLLRMLLHATPLSLPDRALGAAFGLARALVVMLAITTVVMLTSLAHSPAWQASRGAAWINDALHGMKPMLPSSIVHHLPR
jgi:membrane protein required for colicin V production